MNSSTPDTTAAPSDAAHETIRLGSSYDPATGPMIHVYVDRTEFRCSPDEARALADEIHRVATMAEVHAALVFLDGPGMREEGERLWNVVLMTLRNYHFLSNPIVAVDGTRIDGTRIRRAYDPDMTKVDDYGA